MLSNNLNSKANVETQNIVEEIERDLHSMMEDVEIAEIQINLAEYYFQNNKHDKAFDYANKASQKAILSNLIPEMIRANILLGKIQLTKGEYEACFDCYKKGMKLTQQISSGLLTDEDKIIFQNHEIIRSLLSEINKFKMQTVT